MSSKIKEYVKACEVCQKFKITVPKIYGKIPLKNVTHVTPFEHIQVDLAGPWKILLEHEEGKQAQSQIWISTILDIGSNWIKMHPITNKQSPNIAQIFNNEWLCQYPRPIEVTYDTRGKFSGIDFQERLQSYGIVQKPTTIKNPQANGFVKRIHLTIGDHLRGIKFMQKEEWHAELYAILQSIA